MIIILGLDGLDYNYVKEFDCRNLMQHSCGCTDLSEFNEIKTIVIWSSFLAESNMEKEINSQGVLWDFILPQDRTFFSRFSKSKTLDVPGFSYHSREHELERRKLKDFFDKNGSIEDYDRVVFDNYRRNKQIFLNMLTENCDIQMGYFALADSIGHLSFGIASKMKIVYQELDELAAIAAATDKSGLLILSDHGMEAIGRFGDHSRNGFWSSSTVFPKDYPKITELMKTFLDSA